MPDEIQGFPTIKLFAAGKKATPIDYSGARTVEDLANFIRDQGTLGVDAMARKSAAGDDDDFAHATEGMPQQAMAASEAVGAAGKAASAVAGAAKAVADAVLDDDGGAADHDEL